MLRVVFINGHDLYGFKYVHKSSHQTSEADLTFMSELLEFGVGGWGYFILLLLFFFFLFNFQAIHGFSPNKNIYFYAGFFYYFFRLKNIFKIFKSCWKIEEFSTI